MENDLDSLIGLLNDASVKEWIANRQPTLNTKTTEEGKFFVMISRWS